LLQGIRPARPAPLLEPARVEELLAMLGERRVDGLLGLLAAECRERPRRIEFCHARSDLAGLHAEARSLSRAAADVGAVALGDAASSLECLSDLAVAEPLIGALDAAARATLRLVQQRMRRLPALVPVS
jgi:hypothetical protein